MVSGTYYDLKFKNSLSEKLYIRAAAGKGYVTFYFYGKSDGAQYSYASRVTGNIPAPEEVTDDPSRVKLRLFRFTVFGRQLLRDDARQRQIFVLAV